MNTQNINVVELPLDIYERDNLFLGAVKELKYKYGIEMVKNEKMTTNNLKYSKKQELTGFYKGMRIIGLEEDKIIKISGKTFVIGVILPMNEELMNIMILSGYIVTPLVKTDSEGNVDKENSSIAIYLSSNLIKDGVKIFHETISNEFSIYDHEVLQSVEMLSEGDKK